MTRDRALQLTDRLLAAGYTCRLLASPPIEGFLRAGEDPANRQPTWSVSIAELGVDKVDVKALVAIADELGLDCGMHGPRSSEFTFAEPDPTPEAVRNPRRHPR